MMPRRPSLPPADLLRKHFLGRSCAIVLLTLAMIPLANAQMVFGQRHVIVSSGTIPQKPFLGALAEVDPEAKAVFAEDHVTVDLQEGTDIAVLLERLNGSGTGTYREQERAIPPSEQRVADPEKEAWRTEHPEEYARYREALEQSRHAEH